MTPPEKPSSEPSMDEILASIRQIISDDSKGKNSPLLSKENDDILDLTNLLPDESSFFTKNKEKDLSSNENVKLSSQTRQKAERLQPFSKTTFEDSLVSHSTASETAQALHSLTELVQEKQRAAEPLLYKETSNQTIENLTRQILRPLLKEWLDANLPLLVRWVVNEEVEKIMRQKNMASTE